MNWETMTLDLGTVRVNQPVKVTFNYTGDHPELIDAKNIIPSCGCVNPSWNLGTKQLSVLYTPNPVPTHLAVQGKSQYDSTKYVTVRYNGQEDKLVFKAIVKK